VPFYVHKRLDKLWGRIWVFGDQKWGFGVKNDGFHERKTKILSCCLVQLVRRAGGELHSDSIPCLHSCIFFTHFCFELAFGVNMKVLDNCVSF